MKKIDLIQGSPEWLAWRNTKITATDAATICGVDPYRSLNDLWKIKKGEKIPFQNEAMKKGNQIEPILREKAEMVIGREFPAICVESEEYPWMAASIDGMAKNGQIIEIKSTNISKYREIFFTKNIPINWKYQACHIMLCTGSESIGIVLGCYEDQSETTLLNFDRDEKICKEILKKELEFWENWQKGIAPKDDIECREDLSYIVSEMKEIRNSIDCLEKEYDRLKEKLISSCQGISFKCSEGKFEKQTRKGAVEYSKIPELSCVDLEVYRKPSLECWKLS